MSSLRRQVRAGVSQRSDFPLRSETAALLVIDIQQYLSCADHPYFSRESLPRMLQNTNLLMNTFRQVRDSLPAESCGCEVIFTYLQAATKDGRDISVDYKLSGPLLADIPRVGASYDELFCDDCKPDPASGRGDILLPKTSCSVFQSTNLDYLLRNLNIEQLVIAGQLTDQCVESAVRDAADLGYFVTVVDDACAAYSEAGHEKGLKSMKGFCRILTTKDVIRELLSSKTEEATKGNNSWVSQVSQEQVLDFLKDHAFQDAAESLTSLLEKDQKLPP